LLDFKNKIKFKKYYFNIFLIKKILLKNTNTNIPVTNNTLKGFINWVNCISFSYFTCLYHVSYCRKQFNRPHEIGSHLYAFIPSTVVDPSSAQRLRNST
jgi:hypothetical protein